jgi:hypothetical protein
MSYAWEIRETYTEFWWGNLKESDFLEEKRSWYKNIKMHAKYKMGVGGLDSSGSWQDSVSGSFEYDAEFSISI